MLQTRVLPRALRAALASPPTAKHSSLQERRRPSSFSAAASPSRNSWDQLFVRLFSAAHRQCSRAVPPSSAAGLLAWKPAEPAKDVVVCGYVRSVRSMKANSFVALGDGSSLAPLQAVVPAALAGGLANGAAVRLKGSWTASPGAGQSHELHVQAVEILGPSDAKTFPVQKKYQTAEFLRTLPHLRPRIPFNATLLRFRSIMIASLNRFFAERNFVQTHPPLITSSDCEGAGEVFTVQPAAKSAGKTPEDGLATNSSSSSSDSPFFRAPKFLTVSTQLHLEALAQAVGSVWTLSPTFRAEESDTPRHLSEFYMLEAEVPFVDSLDAIMDLVEDMLRYVVADNYRSPVYRELLERPESHGGSRKRGRGGSSSSSDAGSETGSDSHGLAAAQDVEQRWQGMVQHARRWPRVTYTEAIDLLAAAPVHFAYEPTWGAALQTEHERYLATTLGDGGKTPVFVTHYPREIKAFYMLPTAATREGVTGVSRSAVPVSGDAAAAAAAQPAETRSRQLDTVDCFDLLVPEFCEIAGGSMREHRLPQLLDAMQAQGLTTDMTTTAGTSSSPSSVSLTSSEETLGVGASSSSSTGHAAGDLDWYVDLRRWGCPPHGGFGLGFDRLLCYLSGVPTIRDTVAFPRWYGRCDC